MLKGFQTQQDWNDAADFCARRHFAAMVSGQTKRIIWESMLAAKDIAAFAVDWQRRDGFGDVI